MVLRTKLLGERRQRRCGISKDLRKTLGRSFLDEGSGLSLCNWSSKGRNGAERKSGEDGEGLEQHGCGCGGGRKLSERRVWRDWRGRRGGTLEERRNATACQDEDTSLISTDLLYIYNPPQLSKKARMRVSPDAREWARSCMFVLHHKCRHTSITIAANYVRAECDTEGNQFAIQYRDGKDALQLSRYGELGLVQLT